jgi:hypothetical protein
LKILDDKEFIINTQGEKYLFKRLLRLEDNKYTLQLDINPKIQRHVDVNISDDNLAEVVFAMILEHQDGKWFDEQGNDISEES